MSHKMFEAPAYQGPASMPSFLLGIESGLQRFARSLRWACGSAAVAMLLSACGGGGDPAVSPSVQAQQNQVPAAVQTQHSVSRMIAALVQPGSGTEDFESGMADWQNWGNAQVVAGAGTSGSHALQVGTAAGGAGLKVPGVVAGTQYRLTANVRVSDVSDQGVLGVNFYNAAGEQLAAYTSSQAMGTTYASLTLDAVAPANSAYALVWVWKNAGTGYVYVDDVAFGSATASPPPPTDTNLMSNGGFEAGMAGWADWGNTHVVSGQANSGTSALSVGTAAGGAGYVVDGLVSGQTYRMSVSAKVSDASDAVIVGVNFLDASGATVADTQRSTTSTSYTTLSSDVIAPAGTVRALVYVWKNAGSGLGYVDDFWFGSVSGSPPPPPPASDNLVVNGSFDAGLSSWVNWGNTTIAPTAAMAQVGPDAGGFAQSVPGIVAGHTYRLTALANVSVAGDSALLGLQFLDAAGNVLQDQLVPFRSTTVSIVQTRLVAPANAASALVYVWKNAGSGYAFVDDVVLMEPPVPQTSPAPTVQLSPAGPSIPARLDYVRGSLHSLSAARLDGNNTIFAWSRSPDSSSPGQVCYSGPDQFFVGSAAVQPLACLQASVYPSEPTRVLAMPDHSFIIAWDAAGGQYQVFDAFARPVGGIHNGSPPQGTDVALTGGGSVSLVAQGNPVMFQRHASDGTPIGPATPVGDINGVSAQIVPLTGGGFAIAWLEVGLPAPAAPVVVSRMFTADGGAVGGPVVATGGTPPVCSGGVCPYHSLRGMAPMEDGGYLLTWSSAFNGTVEGTFVRRFRADGTPGAAVGRLASGYVPDLVIVANGVPDNFVAAWPQTANGVSDITPRVFDATALR